jgi:DoxX-like family
MSALSPYGLINCLLALLWFINGMYCKLLNFVPRHQAIVERIIGAPNSLVTTKLIGFSEVLMSIWIISRMFARVNAVTQMLIIASMNILEFFLAPDLLLWGRFNAFFALLLIGIIYFNEFVLHKKMAAAAQ